MFKNNDFIKENKKVLTVLASSVVAILLVVIIFNIINNNDDNQDVTTEVPSSVVNPYKLPELGSISLTQQPILYDFVNGSLGLHEDLISMTTATPYFTFVSKDGSSQLYVVMNYGHQSDNEMKNLLPIFSSAPVRIDLNEIEFNSFVNNISAYTEAGGILSSEEDDYTFYAIPYSVIMLDNNAFDMIDSDWLLAKYDLGNLNEEIYAGMGIPTEIIREKCDIQAIKEACGIDFNDSFWDNVNYNSRIKVFNRSDKNDYCILTPIYKDLVAGYGDPLYMFMINGVNLMMTPESLNDYLLENGYESIDDALNNKVYATEKEYNDKFGDI